MSVDIVLVHPGAQHGIYGALGDQLTAVEPPTWTRMIAGYLRDRGVNVAIIDAEAERWSPRDVADAVYRMNPGLVAIVVSGHQPSASTQQMIGASATAREIRNQKTNIPVVMLGNHPSALPVRTLKEEAVDFVIDGEGPISLYELLQLKPLEDIPGLVWKDSRGGVVCNTRAPLIQDLDRDLHGQVWDMLDMSRYRSHTWQAFGDLKRRTPYASIYSTLGCPFQCSFCMINVFQHTNRYRRRSPASIVAEIKMLDERYGVRLLKFADEMFVLAKSHYVPICEGLIAEGLGERVHWWAYSRVDTVEASTLKLLYDAGCRWLALGIESGSKHVRDGAEKTLRTDDVVGVVRTIQAAGINVIGNYIVGLPDDDLPSMQSTLDLALLCQTEFANFYSAMAYPGSKLYDDAIATGKTLPETWRGYSQHNDDCRPLDTEHVDAATVLRFRDEAFTRYFTDANYLAMIERKFGKETLEHVKQMTTYRLKRKLLDAA